MVIGLRTMFVGSERERGASLISRIEWKRIKDDTLDDMMVKHTHTLLYIHKIISI